jgi:predicted RNA-binding Zn-ribbon protein involved in translation (DUF1610 family)
MVLDGDTIKWAPRVPRRLILKLYESHASGRVDEELLGIVGEMMSNRCADIGKATNAALGNMACPTCDVLIVHDPKPRTKASVIQCPGCGWSSTWGAYQKTFQHRQLSGGGATEIFEEFTLKYRSRIRRQRRCYGSTG